MARRENWIWSTDLNGNKTDSKYNVRDLYKVLIDTRSGVFYPDQTTRHLVVGHIKKGNISESIILAVRKTDIECRIFINEYFKTR